MKILVADDIKGWRDYHIAVLNTIFSDFEITEAESATEAYNKILENNTEPFDIVLTDLQMESDYEPLYAGEWLVERIKEMKNYYRTKIIMISATYNIKMIAEKYDVDCIPKATARNFPDSYKSVLLQ